MALNLLLAPPADPAIARRLLATTAFEPPQQAVLSQVVPWTLTEIKLSVHHDHGTDVVPLEMIPAGLEEHAERIVRSSRARWFRPDELTPAVATEVSQQLDRWRNGRRREVRSASALVRAEHGYRMTFRNTEEVVTIEVALSPPRVIHEERNPISQEKRTLIGSLRTIIAGGAAPSRSRASGEG